MTCFDSDSTCTPTQSADIVCGREKSKFNKKLLSSDKARSASSVRPAASHLRLPLIAHCTTDCKALARKNILRYQVPIMSEDCFLLHRLPVELRLRIYEHVLSFERPLKLRQVVAGSKNTSILRANQQIHNEALPVLYDTNTIIVTRNDFCQDTDPDLQTPLRRDQVRRLLVRNFSQSIRCSSFSGGNNMYLEGCCDVCKPSATGFLAVLAALPRVQSVVIDYQNHVREFGFIKDTIRGIGSTSVDAPHGFSLRCIDLAKYALSSPSFPPNLSITFTDLPLSSLWDVFNRLGIDSPFGLRGAPALLARLRDDYHRELPDKLYYLFCARHTKTSSESSAMRLIYDRLFCSWNAVVTTQDQGGNAEKELEILSDLVRQFCDGNTVEDVSRQEFIMRTIETSLLMRAET